MCVITVDRSSIDHGWVSVIVQNEVCGCVFKNGLSTKTSED